MSVTSWTEFAACIGLTHLFYPEQTRSRTAYDAGQAICRTCPVNEECRTWARESREIYGLWGGERPVDRSPTHNWLPNGDFYDCQFCGWRFWKDNNYGTPKYCTDRCKDLANEELWKKRNVKPGKKSRCLQAQSTVEE